jgi:hypothetical protein
MILLILFGTGIPSGFMLWTWFLPLPFILDLVPWLMTVGRRIPWQAMSSRQSSHFLRGSRLWKQQGLIGFGIIASYLRRWVQPLKEREHYGFEYSGAEDPSRMVPALELTEEEVLEDLKKVLKGVTIIPTQFPNIMKIIYPLLLVVLFMRIYFVHCQCWW